jgi:hypothetical protein
MNTELELQTLLSNLPLSEIYEDVKFGPEEVQVAGGA